MNRILSTLLLICGIVGCETLPIIGPVVALYVTWVEGEAHAYYTTDTYTAYRAVKRVLDDLNYSITQNEVNAPNSYYIVADSNDRFKIKIDAIEPRITRISIRINFMGDKPYAELIYKKLEDQLNVIDYTNRQLTYSPTNSRF